VPKKNEKNIFLKGSFRCKCEVMCNYEQQPESKV
jgi:hypothetical protein